MDDDPPSTVRALDIYRLNESHGFKKELTDVFAATATVCMDRHHRSPTSWSVQLDEETPTQYEVSWSMPTERDRRSYNEHDATELGACALALAAADSHLGLIAFARAEPRTGVDFYLLVKHGTDVETDAGYDLDHQSAIGLEVSGIDLDSEARMNQRIRVKIDEIRRARSPERAIAGIVGFRGARIVFRTAKP